MKFFLHSRYPSGTLRSKKFQKTLILAFGANSALSRENKTKIVKITHSAYCTRLCNGTPWVLFFFTPDSTPQRRRLCYEHRQNILCAAAKQRTGPVFGRCLYLQKDARATHFGDYSTTSKNYIYTGHSPVTSTFFSNLSSYIHSTCDLRRYYVRGFLL